MSTRWQKDYKTEDEISVRITEFYTAESLGSHISIAAKYYVDGRQHGYLVLLDEESLYALPATEERVLEVVREHMRTKERPDE